ncbi:MAG: DUF4118 domain-containing protein [Clostridia bacterium]|nr:DUF4118 domain-containing protein [Clostridia bacterium]
MVSALGGSFTALYVRTSYSNRMDEADRKRLQDHIQLAEKLGADITYIYGDDVSHQIAEYARISGVTTIVIGRNNTTRKHFWSKPTLTEQLAETAPSIDIHIIPDNTVKNNYRAKMQSFLHSLISYPRDILVLLLIMAAVTALGLVFRRLGFTESNIITIYILGVLLTSLFTRGYVCSVLASFMSVALFNFFLTEPRLTFHAYGSGYTITFAIMLAASIITGTLASKLKDNAKLSAQTAFRTKVLLDTNQLLQKAQDDDDIINTTATQIMRLLNRSVVLYAGNDSGISKGYLFNPSEDTPEENLFTACERAAAELSFNSKRRAGITTEVMSNTKCLYIPININDKVFGVIGIKIDGKPLDSNENSMLLSILGECALAINNSRNAKEKEQASVLAKNEQLRANLLRAISHDLRTPLTSISGNASNLLNNYDKLDSGTRTQVFNDIYDDSQWLISLVENLLSVTRIEDGRMSLNMSIQLIDEVIEEALRHIHYRGDSHNISVDCTDDLLLARIDAKLIVQVIINLVDNAVKYSPPGCDIIITAKKEGDCISVCVADNGNGIPDELKPRVFDMFYTGDSKITDSRRSLGLGLALCKTIVLAHGGEILLKDNDPQGCVFIFTVPSGEVNVNE